MKLTSVVSLHTDPYSCGVARFSKQLAERLGVPFLPLDGRWGMFPLLSLKWGEVAAEYGNDIYNLRCYFRERSRESLPYGVFWHDGEDSEITEGASVVYYADPSLGSPALWCPSLLPQVPKRAVKLFSFGMAHKLQAYSYRRVRELLEDAGIRYHLRVSVGLHEGTSLSDATKHFDALKEIMGPGNVTILGILSDEAVNLELQNADYVLAFFEKGVRANNTTVHAALQAGKIVVTNHDAQTPGFLRASTRDIVTREEWERTIPYYYSWENLLKQMEEIYHATTSQQGPKTHA